MSNNENTPVKKPVGRYMELSDEERERLLVESREKLRRDIDARERGAKEMGVAIGITQGRYEAQLAIALNALNRNMPLEDIAELTGLPLEEIQTLH